MANFLFGQFKDTGILEEMTVEVADAFSPEPPAFGHHFEKVFQGFSKEVRIVQPGKRATPSAFW